MENIKYISLPVNYSIDTNFINDKFVKLRLDFAHDGENLNHTYFTKEALESNKSSLFFSPLLGHIVQNQDGSYDFGGHDIDFIPNPYQDNKVQQVYLETILGIIPPEEMAEFEIKEVNGKNRVFVNGFLYKKYSNFAEDILRENIQTAVSMETEISKYSYSIAEDLYNILDFEYTGITFLGKNAKPAMEGANAQFYQEHKMNNIHEQMSIVLQDLKKIFSLEDNNKYQNEGGTQTMGENTEVMPVEDVSITDNTISTPVEASVQETSDTTAEVATEVTSVQKNDNASDIETLNTEVKTFSKIFEISHEDIRYGLYQALAVVEEVDNRCYWIDGVYDNYFDYSDYESKNKCYRQNYTVSNDEITFVGERIEMFIEKLTSSELAALNTIRSTYESQTAELEELRTFKSKYDLASKTTLVDKWEEKIGDCPEFIELRANYSEKSIDEIDVACKCIFADNHAFTGNNLPAATYAKTKSNEFTPVSVPIHEVTQTETPKAYNGFIEEYSSIKN